MYVDHGFEIMERVMVYGVDGDEDGCTCTLNCKLQMALRSWRGSWCMVLMEMRMVAPAH